MQHPPTVEDHHAYPAEALSRPQKATDARDAASGFLAGLHPARVFKISPESGLASTGRRSTRSRHHAPSAGTPGTRP